MPSRDADRGSRRLSIAASVDDERSTTKQHVKAACDNCGRFYCVTCWKVCPRCN